MGGDEWGRMLLLHFNVRTVSTPFTLTTVSNVQGTSRPTMSSPGLILTINKAYEYDNISHFEFVGSFAIQLIHNGTGLNIQFLTKLQNTVVIASC